MWRAAKKALSKVLRLLHRHFRRQRRLVRIDNGFDEDRPRCGQRLAQSLAALLCVVDEEGLNAASARRSREIDGLQLAAEFWIAEEHHLLPLDLTEGVVFDDDDLHVQAVFCAGGKLAHQHGKTTIADKSNGLPSRKGDRRRNGVGAP